MIYMPFFFLFFVSGQETGPITWEEPAFLNTSREGKCSVPSNQRSKAVDVDASYPDWLESNVLSRVSHEFLGHSVVQMIIHSVICYYAFLMQHILSQVLII